MAKRSFRSNGIYFLREDDQKSSTHSKNMPRTSNPIPAQANSSRSAMPQELSGPRFGTSCCHPCCRRRQTCSCWIHKAFSGDHRLLIPSEDLRKYRPVQTEMPSEGLLNFKEAASALGTRTEVIRSLVANGTLGNLHDEYRPGLSKLVSAGEIQHFGEQYVDAHIVAERSHATIHWVKPALRQSGVPILEVPVPGKGRKIFLLRELAANVDIPQRCS